MFKPTFREIFTIGHSNHSIEFFYDLLQSQRIDCLVDVRSVPWSSYNPQYNQNALKAFLQEKQIHYLHFQKEFGARQVNKDVLEDGQVRFDRFRETPAFKQGVKRIEQGLAKGYRIALMCAEGDPLHCHRFSMIAVYLKEIGLEVKHILKDQTVVSHLQLEKSLIERYSKKLPQPSLLEVDIDERTKLQLAYRLHNDEVGYKTTDSQ